MYLDFFGLHEKPFSIAPDPRYLYLTQQHREALAHLNFGVGDEGGFILLTGEIGTGKTTICRSVLSELPNNIDLAFIINPRVSAAEMLEAICDEYGIEYQEQSSVKTLVDKLNRFLLESYAAGRHSILIIDEAQNLDDEVLEQIRLLTNLETSEKKLLQLILLGQPELNDKLNQPSMKQLAQRVTARFHLRPLSYQEMVNYIQHRLHVAGFRGNVFSTPALKHIYKRSEGVPRLINVICDRAMLGAYATGRMDIEYPLIAAACNEVLPQEHSSLVSSNQFIPSLNTKWLWLLLLAILTVIILMTTDISMLIQSIFDDQSPSGGYALLAKMLTVLV